MPADRQDQGACRSARPQQLLGAPCQPAGIGLFEVVSPHHQCGVPAGEVVAQDAVRMIGSDRLSVEDILHQLHAHGGRTGHPGGVRLGELASHLGGQLVDDREQHL
ncbi:hypothetical protein FNH08_02000 [Streptomyces spongiae]|uniref:Uncharacterized protein n=1 Tax=Streptomyces spongiae TaxID=565072 RepID=A0A5N8X982_9ACTN|nr:hypothetical protein [Streptomyces spongiae]